MNNEQKVIATKIITQLKQSKNGLISANSNSFFTDNKLIFNVVIDLLINEYGLLSKYQKSDFKLTKAGFEFTSFDELAKEDKKRKERERIEFEKSKVELELNKETLKEFPRTKWFARIGFFIAVLLLLKELYMLIYK